MDADREIAFSGLCLYVMHDMLTQPPASKAGQQGDIDNPDLGRCPRKIESTGVLSVNHDDQVIGIGEVLPIMFVLRSGLHGEKSLALRRCPGSLANLFLTRTGVHVVKKVAIILSRLAEMQVMI